MNNNLCIITNIGAHYRYPIFSLISREIGCDFFLGDKVKQKLKTFDYERLDGYKRTLKNQFLGPFYWQTNSVSSSSKIINTISLTESLFVFLHGLFSFYAGSWGKDHIMVTRVVWT